MRRSSIVEFMSEGMTELEVKRELEETMRRPSALRAGVPIPSSRAARMAPPA